MCIERSLGEPSDGLEDLVGGFGPLERRWVLVVSIEIVLYRNTELRHARVGASSQGVFGEQAKEALSEVEPRGVCGCEVKVEPRSLGKPAFDRRCLVRGEIVEHDVDVQLARNGCFALSEEFLELYRSMSRVALSEDFTCCGVECSKQVSRSMPNVVVGLSLGLAQAHGQDRLSTLERLNLRFLVDAQDDRVIRWVHIQTNNVAYLFDQLWVLRETKRFRAVRLKPERSPNTPNRRMAQPKMLGHRARTPMGSPLWSRLQRLGHDFLDLVIADLASCSWPRFVVQPFHSLFYKATSPLAHRAPHGVHLPSNFHIRQTRRAMQHDLGSEGLVPRTTTASCQSRQRFAFLRRQLQFGFSPALVFHALSRSQQGLCCLAFSVPGD